MNRSHFIRWVLVFFFSVSFFDSFAVDAYEEVDVRHGGSIAGKVTLKGPLPEPRIFALVLYPFGSFCKKISNGHGNVVLQEFIVGEGRGLWETVIAVQGITKGKPFPVIQREFVAVDCMFHPADVAANEQFFVDEKGQMHHEHPNVAILENHQPISMVNKDPIIHNIQVYQKEKGNVILNSPLPVSTKPMGGGLHFSKGKRISQMICGMHEFMQSWGFIVDNPYYAKTAKDGRFKIDGLLPGTYTISIWHPHYRVVEREVTIGSKKTTRLDFEFDGAEVKRPLYETQKQFRISPATPEDHRLHEGEERIFID
ncbi:carboxypeptidase regulatory-like domain-containing protein [bacterium AH-315-L15]|nr:carboxypeptidase regulatory-like domain-containing protein [bacterium AH-315-L15]